MSDREALAAALDWEEEFIRDVQNSNADPKTATAGIDMVRVVFAAARERLAQLQAEGPK